MMVRGHGSLAVGAAGGLLAASVTVGVYGTAWLYLWWVLAPALALAGVLTGMLRHRPVHMTPWVVLTAVLAMLWLGWSSSAVVAAGVGGQILQDVLPWVRDGLYAVAYPLLAVASLLIVRARTGGRDRDSAIDALMIMVALATALGAWLFAGGGPASEVGAFDRVWIRISPLVLAAVVTASVRLLFAAGHRLPAAWLVFTASSLTLVGNLWTAQLLRDGQPTQVLGIDVIWVLAFVSIATASLHPSMRQLSEPVPPEQLEQGLPVDRLLIIATALLVVPLAHLRIAPGNADARLIVAGGVLVALLVMWRIARLLKDRDAAQAAVKAAAARDALVAAIGRKALTECSTEQLLVDVGRLLAQDAPELRARILRHAPDHLPADLSGYRQPIDDGSDVVAYLVADLSSAPAQRAGEPEFLDGVAVLLSSGARRREAEGQLRYAALHDRLTGLGNRALLTDRLEHLLASRTVEPVTVAFLDLDGFKQVNDTFGHEAGDEALVLVADRLTAAVRPHDTVARFAGDEFVVLLPGVGTDDRGELLERIRHAASGVIERGGRTHRVTASLGAASARPGTTSPQKLLHEADLAMYRARHEPRSHGSIPARI